MAIQKVIQFPEKLVIVFVEQETAQPIAGILISVELRATRKNNYHLQPPLSDATGSIIIEREWV